MTRLEVVNVETLEVTKAVYLAGHNALEIQQMSDSLLRNLNTFQFFVRATPSAGPVAEIAPVAVPQWISVQDLLPQEGQQVIAYRPTAAETQDSPLKFVRYLGPKSGRESWQGVTHHFDCVCHPTHWMPLPAAPAAEKAV
jgi:hypothetical protein